MMAMKNSTTAEPSLPRNTYIFDALNIGRKRSRNNRRRKNMRQNKRKPEEDVHLHEEEGDINTNVSSVNGSIQKTSPATRVGEGQPTGDNDGDHEEEDDHDHATDHEDFTCQPTSSQHSAYIRDNLAVLQKKCAEFQECTREVYSAENFHRILAGGNIQLRNICGLMYANGGGEYTTLNKQCTDKERQAIRQGIGERLVSTLAEPPTDNRSSWRRLRRCLNHNRKRDEHLIDTACRMKKTSTFLCEDLEVDHVTEDFFNHEMEHLHCSCKAISAEAANMDSANSSRLPLAVRAGIIGGVVGLLLILIIVIVVLCLRHRRVKRELNKHRMQYLPSFQGEPSAIYQEIGDHTQAMAALRRARDAGHTPPYSFMDQAPALPARYVKDMSASKSDLAAEGDPEYLEPLADPAGRQLEAHANDAYNASQTSQRSADNAYNASQGSQRSTDYTYQLARAPGPSPPLARNDTYFERIQPARTEQGSGYSSLSQKNAGAKTTSGEAASTEETEPLYKAAGEVEGAEGGDDGEQGGEPQYFLLEPQKDDSDQQAPTATTAS
ncbi:uncharacterized protein LOC143281298 [Babylonia areolata]|uniref:uncharacterized protein LOC143281298 n=1 Tax=Babylonia areolata TaxID=304850 RepID=UPI003FD4B0B4